MDHSVLQSGAEGGRDVVAAELGFPDADDPIAGALTRVERLIFRSPLLAMASFRCRSDDPLFADSGPIHNAIFVFPRTHVRIEHEGGPSFLSGPNLVNFYNPGQAFRRASLGDEGDECDWYWVEPGTLREVLRPYDPAAADHADRPFRFAWGPSDPRSYLEQRRAFLHAASAPRPDRLYLEETMVWILDRLLRRASQTHRDLARISRGAARRHADLTEGAKALVTAHAGLPLDLSELARALGCSPFHLCHVFRRQTGFTLSEFQHQIRLRRALDRLGDPLLRLSDLAGELGYASHSHFTLFFRRAFGVTPSSLRARLAGPPARLEIRDPDPFLPGGGIASTS